MIRWDACVSLLDVLLAALSPEDFKLRNRAFLAPLLSGLTATVWEPEPHPADPHNTPKRQAEIFLRELGILLENKKHNAVLTLCRERLKSHGQLSATARLNMEIALERLCEAGTMGNLNSWQMVGQLREWILSGNGAEEEGSPYVMPKGQLRVNFTPNPAGNRWYHTHIMAMDNMARGAYTGQFGFLYIEPKKEPGAYDQEHFLAARHWEAKILHRGDPQNDWTVDYDSATLGTVSAGCDARISAA